MSDDSLEMQSFQGIPASSFAGAGRWMAIDDDVAFGCECADPALQIERWNQEAITVEFRTS